MGRMERAGNTRTQGLFNTQEKTMAVDGVNEEGAEGDGSGVQGFAAAA